MSNWSDPSWKMNVGINHTPAYQVSGRPYASGGIGANLEQQVVNFPNVTRWVEVVNNGSAVLKVGFGPNAFDPANNHYFIVPGNSTSGRLELKVNRLYFVSGSAAGTSVVAGLTSMLPDRVNSGSLSVGINWSGSYTGAS